MNLRISVLLCVSVSLWLNSPQRHRDTELTHFFFAIAFISDSSTTGAGPEMPPSLRIRQKCTAMKIDATNGMPIQCQIYERKRALSSTIDPPNRPKRTSLYGVRPSCG